MVVLVFSVCYIRQGKQELVLSLVAVVAFFVVGGGGVGCGSGGGGRCGDGGGGGGAWCWRPSCSEF